MRSLSGIGAPIVEMPALSEGPMAARWRHAISPLGSRTDVDAMLRLMNGDPSLRWQQFVAPKEEIAAHPALRPFTGGVPGALGAASYLVDPELRPHIFLDAATPKPLRPYYLLHEVAEIRALQHGISNLAPSGQPRGPAHRMGITSSLAYSVRQRRYPAISRLQLAWYASTAWLEAAPAVGLLQALAGQGRVSPEAAEALRRRMYSQVRDVRRFLPQFLTPRDRNSMIARSVIRSALAQSRFYASAPELVSLGLLPGVSQVRQSLEERVREVELILRFNRRIKAAPFPERLRAMQQYRFARDVLDMLRRVEGLTGGPPVPSPAEPILPSNRPRPRIPGLTNTIRRLTNFLRRR